MITPKSLVPGAFLIKNAPLDFSSANPFGQLVTDTKHTLFDKSGTAYFAKNRWAPVPFLVIGHIVNVNRRHAKKRAAEKAVSWRLLVIFSGGSLKEITLGRHELKNFTRVC